MWLIAAVTVILAFYVAKILLKRARKVQLLEKIPGPPAFPIIGNALDFMGSHFEVFKAFHRFSGYGSGICRMYLGLRPYCLLYRASSVEAMLSSNSMLDKSDDYIYLRPWLGTGLLTSTGSKWKSRRKLLTPTFHFKILEDFLDVFNRQAKRMVEKMSAIPEGNEFNVFPYSTLCTLDIIMETAMGVDMNAQSNSDSDYVQAIYRLGNLVQTRQASPWLETDFIFRLLGYEKEQNKHLEVLHGTSMSIIRKRKEEYIKKKSLKETEDSEDVVIGKKTRRAFLDSLLDASENSINPLSDEDLREEVDTFMFEGHDTTAAGIAHCLYFLGRHTKIQERVYEELVDVADADGNIGMEQLRELKYLDCCIKESLRILPSVPFIGRKLAEPTEIDGYLVPEGTNLVALIYSLHRDPVYFPNPDKFEPERFLQDATQGRHPYAYVPFSAGPRNCIGQKFASIEEKIVIGSIIREFKVTATQRMDELNLLGELVLRPKDGIIISLAKRD